MKENFEKIFFILYVTLLLPIIVVGFLVTFIKIGFKIGEDMMTQLYEGKIE